MPDFRRLSGAEEKSLIISIFGYFHVGTVPALGTVLSECIHVRMLSRWSDA